ncbi:MBL fold metallo-hydrolase [Bacillus sp. AG4(2022)]|nr:MBL fold metallo-hydrolase [Bacillus sp. AG4(2022)]MDT0158884.1 MBL fold metallo-hydrolase [Bacillus sp. AG4(2022)]
MKNITPDVHCLPIQIVNVFYAELSDGSGDWVLIDAGMPKSADKIIEAAEDLYGVGAAPKAIVLTHGHFDHIGGIIGLLKTWKVPVYAHELELPYLTGEKDYPKPDASVEGGMIAKMSPLFPHEGIDISEYIHPLPSNGFVPPLPGWKWIHTPGHSPGHVSLFREDDSLLIAGDAFVTVRQDSLYKVLVQEEEVNGPPRYLTTDWKAAEESVIKLAALNPSAAGTGHGRPMSGPELAEGLQKLADHFGDLAVPDHGKYVDGNA